MHCNNENRKNIYSATITIIGSDGKREVFGFDGTDEDIEYLEGDTSLMDFALEFDLDKAERALILEGKNLSEIQAVFLDGEKEIYSVSTLY